jgi:methionyl-tRNA synthetase
VSDATAPNDRPLLVTSALPYANGPLHFGHIAGAYLPADLFVRYQRLKGTDVLYICGSDEHGVAITVNAEREGKTYQEYVDHWHADIQAFFAHFGISFDHYSRTSAQDPHYPLSQEFFLRLLREGHVAPKAEQQHYCTSCDRFLPDRYVEGTCYVCNEPAARGDECKACGAWLEATRITEPRCATCGSTPELRDTMQYELDLSPLSAAGMLAAAEADAPSGEPIADMLWRLKRDGKKNVQSGVFGKLLIEGEGLASRPITRDLRWGVPVPATDLDGNPVEGHDGKVLYVWFDAPIGYVSATIEWARQAGGDADAWRRYWIATDAHDPRLVHFIGKDNIPFHCVVFPAMLAWQGEAREGDAFIGPNVGERWVLPENVPANEFYNLEGRKFSTSDQWTLDTARMEELFGTDALRWYVTTSMPETADSQFTFAGLQSAVNADLADVMGNYASRVLKFTRSHLGGVVPAGRDGHADEIAVARAAALAKVAEKLEAFRFREAAEAVVDLGRLGNQIFNTQEPWKTRKTDLDACGAAVSVHVQILATLSVLLTPFVPTAAARLREMLALPPVEAWTQTGLAEPLDASAPHDIPVGHALGEPGILFAKIPDEIVEQERAALAAKSADAADA